MCMSDTSPTQPRTPSHLTSSSLAPLHFPDPTLLLPPLTPLQPPAQPTPQPETNMQRCCKGWSSLSFPHLRPRPGHLISGIKPVCQSAIGVNWQLHTILELLFMQLKQRILCLKCQKLERGGSTESAFLSQGPSLDWTKYLMSGLKKIQLTRKTCFSLVCLLLCWQKFHFS